MQRLVIIALLSLATAAQAAEYYINPRLETQVRQNSLSEREIPLSAYLDTGISGLPNSGTFDVSLKNNRTFKIEEDEFDLYQAVWRMQDLGGVVDVASGRQFVSPGFHAYLLDGASFSIGKDSWPLLISVIGGVPRYIETGDFHGTTGLVSGVTLELQGMGKMHSKLSAVYDKLDIGKKDWKQNETVLVGMNHSHYFSGKVKPSLYGSMEYDTAGKNIETGLVGFSIEPTKRLYWNIEGGHYNTNRSRSRTTIFGLYAIGAFYQGRTGISFTAFESAGAFEDLVLTGGYSYQRFSVSSGVSKSGNIADAGFRFHITPLYLDTGVTYRFYDSFGGRAHDVILNLHDEPIDKLFIDTGANYTKYSKITNEADTAISSFLSAGYEIVKGLQVSATGEYLRNNTFSSEFRGLVKLAYVLEGKL